MQETELYGPVKALLEGQGYEVKGEIGSCDLVAVRGDEPPVIVELKLSFTLALVHQGIDRQGVTDNVYLAVPPFTGRSDRARLREAEALCRRLGLGLMTVRAGDAPVVEVRLDPAEYRPRKRKARAGRLLREFQRRVGDPAQGGSGRRGPMMTAYRQDALRCAILLDRDGPLKASILAARTRVPKARAILYRDVYGWFERVETGVYAITPKGTAALDAFGETVAELEKSLSDNPHA